MLYTKHVVVRHTGRHTKPTQHSRSVPRCQVLKQYYDGREHLGNDKETGRCYRKQQCCNKGTAGESVDEMAAL